MKRFVKGGIETTVDDNDNRIADYLANGWKEAELPVKAKDAATEQLSKAIADANDSEATDAKKKKRTAADKKVNDAIAATNTAARDSVAVDDGLMKSGGKA